MSFGFAVGDFLTVGQFAWKIYKKCKRAGSEFEEISREVVSLHTVIKELVNEAQTPESLLNRKGADRKPELDELLRNCMNVLWQLQGLTTKYQSLGTQSRKGWDSVKFGTEGIESIRSKLIIHAAAITLFLSSLGNSSLGRIEKKSDEILAEIKAGRRESTILSLSEEEEDEDDRAWMTLRIDLVHDGFTIQEVELHKAAIKAYLRKLLLSDNLGDTNKRVADASNSQLSVTSCMGACKEGNEISQCNEEIQNNADSETESTVSDPELTYRGVDCDTSSLESSDGYVAKSSRPHIDAADDFAASTETDEEVVAISSSHSSSKSTATESDDEFVLNKDGSANDSPEHIPSDQKQSACDRNNRQSKILQEASGLPSDEIEIETSSRVYSHAPSVYSETIQRSCVVNCFPSNQAQC